MRKLSTVLRRPAFLLMLFIVAAVAFCKPVLLAVPNERPGRVLLSLFVPWGIVVVLLFLVGIGHDEHEAGAGDGERNQASAPEGPARD